MPAAPIVVNAHSGSRRSASVELVRYEKFCLLTIADANTRYPATMQFSRREWAQFLNAGQDLLAVMPVEREA